MPDINPFSISKDNAVPSNPFWSGVIQGDTEREAAPFIQNAQQSQALDLQRKAIETGEFSDPRAVRARMSGHDLTATKNESEGRLTPKREEAEVARLREEVRSLPHITDAKIAQSQQMTNVAEGTPYHALHGTLASLYPDIHDKPLDQQMQAYSGAIRKWKQENPRAQLPAHFDPDNMMTGDSFKKIIMPDIQHMFLGGQNTPEQVGKERIVALQGNNQINEQRVRNQGSQTVAEINADAHVRGAQLHLNSGETPPKAIVRLQKELRQNPDNQEAQRELTGYINSEFETRFSKDGRGQMLAVQANSDPKASEMYEQYKAWKKAEYYGEHGIDQPGAGLKFPEFQWMQKAMELNPSMSADQVVEQGRKLKKITSRQKGK